MSERALSSGVRFSAALLIVLGCGGTGSGDADAASGERMADAAPATASRGDAEDGPPSGRLTLDYGPQAPVEGFVRFEGSCQTFPYNLQYPEGWEVQATGGYAISKTRTDDTVFYIRVEADHGSVHARNLEQTVIGQGAREVGRVEIGGHDLRVLGRDESYLLHTPHGAGASLHNLSVSSTLGTAETLRILDTLEPLEAC